MFICTKLRSLIDSEGLEDGCETSLEVWEPADGLKVGRPSLFLLDGDLLFCVKLFWI